MIKCDKNRLAFVGALCSMMLAGAGSASALESVLGEAGDAIHVSAAGDFNSDGLMDVAVCSASNDEATGMVRVYLSSLAQDTLPESAGLFITGATTYDLAGTDCVALDLNGDGTDDLAIARRGTAFEGHVSVILGGPAFEDTTSVDDAGVVIYSGDDMFDASTKMDIDRAGDVNADGYDDLLIGLHGDDTAGANAGAAYLVLGSANPASSDLEDDSVISFTGERAGDAAGWSVSGAGDVNSDGFDDILIGAYLHDPSVGADAGAAYVVFGSASPESLPLSDSQVLKISGIVAGDKTGYAVSAAGDVNGDGHDDFVVGVPQAAAMDFAQAGAVWLILGDPTLGGGSPVRTKTFIGTASAQAGTSLASAGDVNGDGYADFVIGEPYRNLEASSYHGAVYVIFGKGHFSNVNQLNPGKRIRRIMGQSSMDYLGRYAAALHFTPAGEARLACISSSNDENGTDAGQIWYLGLDDLPGYAEGFEITLP